MADLAGWPYWKVVSITGQAGSGTDYQVELEIGDSAGGDFHLEGHCTNFPQDIRITDDDGTTLLDHFVLDLTADPIVVKIEVKDDLASNQNIRVYYGKSGETTASSGTNTFPTLFDDFPGSSFDAQWTSVDAQWSVSGGNAVHTVTGAGVWDQLAAANVVVDGVMTAKIKISNDGANDELGLFVRSDGNYDDTHVIQCISRLDNPDFTHFDWGVHEGVCANAINYDTWHYLKVIFDGVNIKTYYSTNGSSWTLCQAFTTTHTTEDDIGLRAVQATSYIDYVYVRKYNDPEPAFSSAGAE